MINDLSADPILVICAQGIGNTLLATPLLAALQHGFPSQRLVALTWDNGSEKVLRDSPCVDQVLVMRRTQSRWRILATWIPELRRRHFSHVFLAWPGGITAALLAGLSGARVRVGHDFGAGMFWAGRLFTHALPRNSRRHDLERNLDLALCLGLQVNHVPKPSLQIFPSERRSAKTFLRASALGQRRLVGIAPGSSRSQDFKRWPLERFADLANLLHDEADASILLFAGPEEEELVTRFTDKARCPTQAIQGRTLGEAAALIASCNVLVSNDAGLMHVATAVGTPVAAVMGPTDPERTRPYGPQNRVVRLGLHCSPCYDHFRRDFRCSHPTPYACMRELSTEQVCGTVMEMLSG